MAHMVETMAYAGVVPWHGLGVNVPPNLSPRKMLEVAGLDWKVEKHQIMTEGGIVIPNRFALIRDSDSSPLGVCSDKYLPIQNEEAFDFFTRFTKAGRMTMETAGSLDGGRRVWGLARMKQGDFVLANDDEVEGYLLLCKPHVVGAAMSIMYTPIRVVCHNTLTMALRGIDNRAEGVFRMAHKREFDEDVKELAREVLGLSDEQMTFFKESAKYLASKRATDKMMTKFFANIYQPKLEVDVKSKNFADLELSRTVRNLKEITEFQPGHDMSAGTWWTAFNAVTFFHDHIKGRGPDSRMNVSWFGMGAKNKMRALNLALDYAKQSRAA